MNDFKIAASIMAADPLNLGKEISCAYEAGVDWLHFDVMDYHYVPNLTYGPSVCKAIREQFQHIPIDVHLMATPVDNLISDFAAAGASIITIHPEATQHVDRSISLIKNLGCKAGIALNPGTPLYYLDYLIKKVDLILIMSVNPGFGGQAFIPTTLKKLTDTRNYLKKYCGIEGKVRIEVDGGIRTDNIASAASAGADAFVAGSSIFGSSDRQSVISAMKKELYKCAHSEKILQKIN